MRDEPDENEEEFAGICSVCDGLLMCDRGAGLNLVYCVRCGWSPDGDDEEGTEESVDC